MLRQILFTLWTYLNLFGGIPSLLITPLCVWRSRNHQLFYDSLLQLKTEPREETNQVKIPHDQSPLREEHALSP